MEETFLDSIKITVKQSKILSIIGFFLPFLALFNELTWHISCLALSAITGMLLSMGWQSYRNLCHYDTNQEAEQEEQQKRLCKLFKIQAKGCMVGIVFLLLWCVLQYLHVVQTLPTVVAIGPISSLVAIWSYWRK